MNGDAPPARPCPVCGKPVAPGAGDAPFCSRRCRLVDLGRWLDEAYRIRGGEPAPDPGSTDH